MSGARLEHRSQVLLDPGRAAPQGNALYLLMVLDHEFGIVEAYGRSTPSAQPTR